jgi:hypothetical protein
VQRTASLPCLSLELSHFELCPGHNSKLQTYTFLSLRPILGASFGSTGIYFNHTTVVRKQTKIVIAINNKDVHHNDDGFPPYQDRKI